MKPAKTRTGRFFQLLYSFAGMIVVFALFFWAVNELFGGGCRNVRNSTGQKILWFLE